MNTDEHAGNEWAGSTLAAVTLKRRIHLCSSVFICVLGFSVDSRAEVSAKDAWVRSTVPAQKTTGAFVTFESTEDARIVGVKSPAAKTAEIHSSEMKGGVMHMHAIDELPLPAGKRVELAPGGRHVMLMGLARPLGRGDTVSLTFTVEDAKGRRTTLEVTAPVRPLGR